ncbi:MAG: type II toxin-antitoxin system RelE/ParE family toxin [Bacteroidia bacterium]|nr:type II toxin-antitoxin system RelE/ParE family toxin [Bacteroidia bacterium]
MKVIYSDNALEQLQNILDFLVHTQEMPPHKAIQIRDQILDRADEILVNIYMSQKEDYLEHLQVSHRRVVVSHYKIIYTIKEEYILITDIFDTRQDPKKMKG